MVRRRGRGGRRPRPPRPGAGGRGRRAGGRRRVVRSRRRSTRCRCTRSGGRRGGSCLPARVRPPRGPAGRRLPRPGRPDGRRRMRRAHRAARWSPSRPPLGAPIEAGKPATAIWLESSSAHGRIDVPRGDHADPLHSRRSPFSTTPQGEERGNPTPVWLGCRSSFPVVGVGDPVRRVRYRAAPPAIDGMAPRPAAHPSNVPPKPHTRRHPAAGCRGRDAGGEGRSGGRATAR